MTNAIRDVVAFAPILAGFALFAFSLVWAYRDAESRGKSGLLVILMIALMGWLPGLLVWYLLRPQATTVEPD